MRTTQEVQNEADATLVLPRQFILRNSAIRRVVRMVQDFKSDIFLSVGSLKVDAKSSLMALMFLSAIQNQPLVVTAKGADADKAVRALSGVFQTNAQGLRPTPLPLREPVMSGNKYEREASHA